jgi:carboxypeptidase C (cathepsin A)
MGNLPDAPAFVTATYSGYLTVTDTKRLHYVFAESESDPANDPVVIWFNGGPGCSSMLAFMQENGPIAIDDGESYIKTNPFPWNKRANMLWLESPAGVGWSVGETKADLSHNDMTQSEDALQALKSWYAKFPEYLPNQLFVSGESYAGIYVPYLTWQIYQNNQQAVFNKDLYKMNLSGMLVGNGCTNWDVDTNPALPETLFNFNIIPKRLLDAMNDNNCKFYGDATYPHPHTTPICLKTWGEIQLLMSKLNIYDLYRHVYPTDSAVQIPDVDRQGHSWVNGELKTYTRGMKMSEYTPWLKYTGQADPILGDYFTDYMNREDVRAAFNIPTEVQGWSQCTRAIDYHELDECSMWIYPILRHQTRILKYSGDTDGAVPTYGTKQWIKMLDWPVEQEWRPWFTEGQVSGYVEQYDGLDFVTIKGVGHMAPQWARQPTQEMVLAWIHNESF